MGEGGGWRGKLPSLPLTQISDSFQIHSNTLRVIILSYSQTDFESKI